MEESKHALYVAWSNFGKPNQYSWCEEKKKKTISNKLFIVYSN